MGEAVGATLFLRGIIAGDEDEDWGDYWRREFVKFGSYEVTADGLTVDCRAGGDGFGAVGRFFDESGTSFGHAGSLGAYLADVADSLEGGGAFQGDGATPVVFNGALIWERAQAPDAGWGRADESLPGAEETLPALSLDRGEPRLRAVYIQGLGVLGALIATLPRERVAEAAVRQMCRLAAETGLAKYAEVAHALDEAGRGHRVEVTDDNPLGLRLRSVIAQAETRRDNYRKWAAESMVVLLRNLPHRAVDQIRTVRSHVCAEWRGDLLEDLGSPPLPPAPDELFWANLRNPAIDTDWYADRYGRTTSKGTASNSSP